ncbi:hypothetical protein SAMN05216386_0529 [Nitrosospira briensis]|uniref:Uncharacterized protein n=1 Tax=Nitrosospira briensis TaxID=35799 RepID=A0A1I4Y782_9PROT|nr:hypothetical protein [Nitrosospira briensis]SFN33360.1 hypothetical protein SAMN05216386_0529 [Nitrosospira briensis]
MNKAMNINLHIDRLILDGINIPHSQRHLLQASVEGELTRLLTEGGVAQRSVSGTALPHVQASGMNLSSATDPTYLGRQIAQSVYGGFGK